MRALLLTSFVAAVACLAGGLVRAQALDPEGAAPMIAPDGGTAELVTPPSGALSAPSDSLPPSTERFDIDCDPDLEVCVDPYAGAAPSPGGLYDDGYDPNAYQQFESTLSPYGTWFDDPSYGRVWVPHTHVVGAGFRPYTHGHWENTEWGWTWVDHHPFGWATGHYGRWFYDSSYGWVWVPGRVWSPAWVTWRSGGGYVGWAPMPPGSYYGGAYTVYDTSWVFVSYSGFGYSSLANDVEDMAALVRYLRGIGKQKIILMGASTGTSLSCPPGLLSSCLNDVADVNQDVKTASSTPTGKSTRLPQWTVTFC